MAEGPKDEQPRGEDVDRSTRILLDKIGIALSLILAVLAVVGEALGWWGALGIVLAVFSLVLGTVSVVHVHGSRVLAELNRLRIGQRALHADHRSMLAGQKTMVENQEIAIDHQASIGSKLDSIEGILDERLSGG